MITSPNQVMVHEFTHILQAGIEVLRPVWLNEGVACQRTVSYL